jgi:AcrR family transcriptional regulator
MTVRDATETAQPAQRSGRRAEQRAATRARLFEETVAEFQRSGFNGTEIGAVVERVGVSRGTFYLYFADKQAVLRELLLAEEHLIAAATLRASEEDVPLDGLFQAVVDAVLRAERRLGRPLVRDLCAGQFLPGVTQGQSTEDHPVGLQLVEILATHAIAADPVDVAMTFLTGLFGLLATDESPVPERRRRLDLLVRMAVQGATTS